MNTAARILAIEDEQEWRDNFKAWIPGDIAIQDSASTAREAAGLIRRFHYDLVLLDLAMDVTDHLNRDTWPIQQYLATKPDGTRYIVISGVVNRRETKEAAYNLGAANVFFKNEVNPAELAQKSAEIIAEASNHRYQAVLAARKKLAPDHFYEHNLFSALKVGAEELYSVLDTLLRALAPIAQHADRPNFALVESSVMALFWSRRHGTAVSVILVQDVIAEQAALKSLADWLGFSSRGAILLDTQLHHIRIRAFEEPTIGDAHFALPAIRLTP